MSKKRIISIFFIFLVIFTNISFNTTRATEATKIYVWVKTEDERPIANARVWVFEPYEHGGYQEPYFYSYTDSDGLITQNIFGTHVKYKVELPDGTWLKPQELTDLKEGEERDLYFIVDHYPGCADTVVTGEVMSVWGGYFDDYLTFTLKIDEVLKHYPESGDMIKKGRETEVVVYIYEKICKEGDKVEVSGRYAFFFDSVEVPIGLCSEMYVKVLTESSSSILWIICNVSGYDLFIDGEYVLTEGSDGILDGRCSVPIEAGDHIITLERGGCDSVTQFIKIERGQTLYLEFEMECYDPCKRDSDNDGVPDCEDKCEDTPPDYYVDEKGCRVCLNKKAVCSLQAQGLIPLYGIIPSTKIVINDLCLLIDVIDSGDSIGILICINNLVRDINILKVDIGLTILDVMSGGGSIELSLLWTGIKAANLIIDCVLDLGDSYGADKSFYIGLHEGVSQKFAEENIDSMTVFVGSPVKLVIKDEKGNILSKDNDMGIPGSFFFEHNEYKFAFIVNPEGKYEIQTIGTNEGTYDLKIKVIMNGKIIESEESDKIKTSQGKVDIYKADIDQNKAIIKKEKTETKKPAPTNKKTQTPVPTDGITKPPITPPRTIGDNNYLYVGIIIAIIIASIVLVYSRGYLGTMGGGTTDSGDGYISDWEEEETGSDEEEGYISDWEEEETSRTTEEEGFVGWNEEETTETGEEEGYVGW